MNKFKPGDKVIVVGPSCGGLSYGEDWKLTEDHPALHWVRGMDRCVGETAIIDRWINDLDAYIVVKNPGVADWYFAEGWLRLAEEETIVEEEIFW